MTNIMKHEKPKVTSLERLAELAEQKRAVVFNNGIIKPAAVVLNMQGTVIAAMIRNGNLFEYIKPVPEKKSPRFYRSGKVRRPLYAELEQEIVELKKALNASHNDSEKSNIDCLKDAHYDAILVVSDFPTVGQKAEGRIYSDRKRRAEDGAYARTSIVISIKDSIIQTRNTRYYIIQE
ncbi:MAG: hypothetical protein AB7F25_06865 [Deferribacterales bacterium]